MRSAGGVWRLRGRRGFSRPDRDERERRDAESASGSWARASRRHRRIARQQSKPSTV